MTTPDPFDQLSSARHEAGDDETVSAVVDGAGQVVEVRIEAKAMRMDAARLAVAVTETVQAAQLAARAALPASVGGVASPDTASLSRLATELGASAQQRLTDISATLDRLIARDSTDRQG
ncbi:hypothetical protein [uncultured Jatrophihabitans sp.]|uniref:hypothetical protein n=1 Tax=uncultured Jatrophihabitans sp. TaxID=1610747 RepID=UPI0035CBCB64